MKPKPPDYLTAITATRALLTVLLALLCGTALGYYLIGKGWTQ